MPFGASSTAAQVAAGVDLSGKTAIVTGGNSGIGVETVRALASAGCQVILACRSVKAGQVVADDCWARGFKGSVVVRALDLADLVSVRNFASGVTEGPDLLILNAGLGWSPLSHTRDGFELQMGTNHFGHFYLTQLLLPGMKKLGRPARVISVASEAHRVAQFAVTDLHYHRRKYARFSSYGNTKLANILFIKELAKRCEGSNVTAFSLHPGLIVTGFGRHVIHTGGWVFRLIKLLFFPFLKSPEQVWLASTGHVSVSTLKKTLFHLLNSAGAVHDSQQGAATTVYAATAKGLEKHSGAYLMDCKVGKPAANAEDAGLAAQLWLQTHREVQAALEARQRGARDAVAAAEDELRVLGQPAPGEKP